MGSKILCVGGCGYLSGLIVNKLQDCNYDITVYDNLLYEERFLKPVKFIFGDILETDRLVSIANDFDIVVFAAALVGDPACQIDVNLTNKINHLAVKDFCQKLNKDVKMIFFSTCSVYGMNDEFLNEDSATNPLSAYATTKLAAEKYVLDRGGCVFRLGTIYGMGDNYSRLRLDLVVNVMTMKAFLDGKLTVNGGEQWRPIISANDVAEYTVRCVQSFRMGIYILSYKNVLIKELGEEIAGLIPGTQIEYTEMSFQDARNYKIKSDRAKYAFGYEPFVTVADEVQKMHKIFSEGRVKDPHAVVYHNGLYLNEYLKNNNV
jgi:nucleoside-diphosphate-sugar epimerase